jgi:hypothetical protein
MNAKTPQFWASDPQVRALRIEISAEHSLVLPFDQFVFAELTSERKEQQLRLVFATHEVLVLGHSLRRIETAIQRLELSLLAKVPTSQRNLITDGQPMILEITVTEVKPEKIV